jgi:ABC-2 type transport system ATP-binding protein
MSGSVRGTVRDTMSDARLGVAPSHDAPPLVFQHVSKQFNTIAALASVSISIPQGAIVGLIGRNGSGKSTLLHHATGLQLPTSGTCHTFGVLSSQLGAMEHSRIGVVHQHAKLLGWMRVSRLVAYVGSFYNTWDSAMVARLLERLRLAPTARVDTLSPGSVQSLSLLLALAHRPELLLLDEPLSDLDPITRADVIALLLEYYAETSCTIVISSHLLHDIEPMVTRIVCLSRGRVTADAELDELKEAYEEWIVSARGISLPTAWSEPGIVRAEGDEGRARLVVQGSTTTRHQLRMALSAQYDADIETRPLNLEKLFPLLSDA